MNPIMEGFLKENKSLIENLNYYKWAKFYEHVNDLQKTNQLSREYKFDVARKDETIYRTILAQEFELLGKHEPRINTLELLMKSEKLQVDQRVDIPNAAVEEEFYKDFSHMKKYLYDPHELIKHIKKEKNIF